MVNCPNCGSEMIQGFTSSYCKAECDLKKPQSSKLEREGLMAVWYDFNIHHVDMPSAIIAAKNGFVPDNSAGYWWFHLNKETDSDKEYNVNKEDIYGSPIVNERIKIKANSYLYNDKPK